MLLYMERPNVALPIVTRAGNPAYSGTGLIMAVEKNLKRLKRWGQRSSGEISRVTRRS
jgi:hypothetical protein